MKEVQCSTQAEMDAALKAGDRPILIGSGYFEAMGNAHVVAKGNAYVVAIGSAHVVAWGNAYVVAKGNAYVVAWESTHVVARGSTHVVAKESARIEAWESAHVEAMGNAHVVAWGSTRVEAMESTHVVARGSTHVVAWGSTRVEAMESAHVNAMGNAYVVAWGSTHVVAKESAHVVARESAYVEAWESTHVEASKFVAVQIHSPTTKIIGGVQINIVRPNTVTQWAAFYGVKITKGKMVLYKGVRDDFNTDRGVEYKPGSTPVAPDWDGGNAECGGGLHFSPRPSMTLEFYSAATKFIACPVAVKDCRAPQTGDMYPQKIKAKGLCGPCWEVNILGEKV